MRPVRHFFQTGLFAAAIAASDTLEVDSESSVASFGDGISKEIIRWNRHTLEFGKN